MGYLGMYKVAIIFPPPPPPPLRNGVPTFYKLERCVIKQAYTMLVNCSLYSASTYLRNTNDAIIT